MAKEITAGTILNKSRHRDKWFLDDYTVNPYSGCSFNCLYCYIRGSKYGLHMDKSLSIKVNAAGLLDKKLSSLAAKDKYGIIVLASATDPYLQAEKEYGLTRKLLEVILKHRFPVHIITKSDLVPRDFDLLKEINERAVLPADLEGKLKHKTMITFSFTSLEGNVSRIFEPGAAAPAARLMTLEKALEAGFHSGVSLMPLLPYISDTEDSLEGMYRQFSEMGVKYLFASPLTLFGNGRADSKTLVINAVKKYYPHLADKYVNLFKGSYRIPAYYNYTVQKKLNGLSAKYGLKNSII